MLTRLKITGFKNLIDVDVHFGPFTCIAGANAVGKSNIFDAIQFLSLLADKPLSDAASHIRARVNSNGERSMSAQSIFHRIGNEFDSRMFIQVEMIIPTVGEDELGQPASATYNFLKYSLELGLNDSEINSKGPLKLYKEELVPINKGKANKHLLFEHAYKWRNSAIQGKRNVPFISTTKDEEDNILINMHQDGGSSGKPRPFLAKNLPRTVLSTARYASETPTLLLARREMQSWKLLQLEPSSLRDHDELDKFSSNVKLGSDGSGLPATVFRLANYDAEGKYSPNKAIYTQLANKLSELIPGVKSIEIDKDEKRQILTLNVISKDGTILPARSLSDGTLRFLGLAVLDLDITETGLICLEEPENGIHPERISAIIELLRSIPLDPFEENSKLSNPLRQVIINTHSPKVVYEIPAGSLLYAELREFVRNDSQRIKSSQLSALSDTWRTEKGGAREISKGKLIAYFNLDNDEFSWLLNTHNNELRVKDREDLKVLQGKLF